MSEITPEHARIVLAVHACGTTTGAAERSNLTQSAVSKAVARVEAQLGTPLFERRRGRLHLRPPARELLDSVLAVDCEWRLLLMAAARLRSGEAVPLDIITTPSIGHGVLAQALGSLKRDFPSAKVRLAMGDPVDVLRSGRAEIGFMFSPRVGPEFETSAVLQGRMVVLVHRDDPLAERTSLRLEDLETRRLICFDRHKSPLGWLVAHAFEAAGRLYAPYYSVTYCLTAAHLAANRCGIALVDDFVLYGQPFEELVQRPLEPEIPIEITMMWRRNQPLSQLGKALMQVMERRGERPLEDGDGAS